MKKRKEIKNIFLFHLHNHLISKQFPERKSPTVPQCCCMNNLGKKFLRVRPWCENKAFLLNQLVWTNIVWSGAHNVNNLLVVFFLYRFFFCFIFFSPLFLHLKNKNVCCCRREEIFMVDVGEKGIFCFAFLFYSLCCAVDMKCNAVCLYILTNFHSHKGFKEYFYRYFINKFLLKSFIIHNAT